MAGELITGDYQVEFNGVLFGGTQNEVVTIDMWQGVNARTSDVDRFVADGMHAGRDFAGSRTFTVEIEVWGKNADDLRARAQQALTFSSISRLEKELVVQLPSWPRLKIDARARRRNGFTITKETDLGHVMRGAVQFTASDPRWYTVNEEERTGYVTSVSGGLTFDISGDIIFGANSASTPLVCNNTGTYETWPRFVITGPITNPIIEHQLTGQSLSFIGTIADGEELIIESRARTVLLGGSASRYNWLVDPSNWFALEPGNTEIIFRGVVPDGEQPTLSTFWRNAWL